MISEVDILISVHCFKGWSLGSAVSQSLEVLGYLKSDTVAHLNTDSPLLKAF